MAKIKLDETNKDSSLLDLGSAIAKRREEKGLSQFRLGLLSQTTQSYISDLESGRRNPSFLILRRIADALECSLSSLLEEAEAYSKQRKERFDNES